jgi:hypothetical protein
MQKRSNHAPVRHSVHTVDTRINLANLKFAFVLLILTLRNGMQAPFT